MTWSLLRNDHLTKPILGCLRSLWNRLSPLLNNSFCFFDWYNKSYIEQSGDTGKGMVLRFRSIVFDVHHRHHQNTSWGNMLWRHGADTSTAVLQNLRVSCWPNTYIVNIHTLLPSCISAKNRITHVKRREIAESHSQVVRS